MSQYPNAPYSGGPTDPSAYGYQQDPRSQKKGLAIASLVLGILAIVTFWTAVGGIVLGLIGLILGIVAILGANKGRNGGKGLAIAGVVVSVLGLLAGAAWGIFLGAIFTSDDAQQLRECLSDAGSDTAAQDQCQREFQDNFGN